jgi:hypothetical protein
MDAVGGWVLNLLPFYKSRPFAAGEQPLAGGGVMDIHEL